MAREHPPRRRELKGESNAMNRAYSPEMVLGGTNTRGRGPEGRESGRWKVGIVAGDWWLVAGGEQKGAGEGSESSESR